jgi:hypothetical protein
VEILVIGAIFFVIALVVRRREALRFRWQPTQHTWVAVGTGLLAFAFSASLFSLTRNLLVIWPLFHAVGVMLDFAVNIGAVEGIGHEFPWAVGVVALMVITGAVLIRVRQAQPCS